jgi:cell wall-associated NlpC family hydrolase
MQTLRDYAMKFAGVPYKWGGTNPMQGFDCSGFVREMLASVGANPPGELGSQGLFNYFEGLGRQCNQAKMGVLVFYGTSVTGITHVALALDAYRIIEAAGGGSTTLLPQDAAAQNAFVKIRLIDYRKDRVAMVWPSYAAIGYP